MVVGACQDGHAAGGRGRVLTGEGNDPGGGGARDPVAGPDGGRGGPRHRAPGRTTGPGGIRGRGTGPRGPRAEPAWAVPEPYAPGRPGPGTFTTGPYGPYRADGAGPATRAADGGGRQARRLVVLVVGMAVLVGVLTSLYGWTVTSLRPRSLPVLAAGPADAAKALAEQLSDTEPGALRVRVVADGDAADAALRAREAYAAFVVGPSGLSLHVASAASPAVSEAMQHGITQVAPNAEIPVVDVVPNAPADHVGGGLSAGYLPLVLVVAAGGVLLARATPRRRVRLAGLVGLAVAAGASGAAALRYGLDVLPGSYLAAAGVLTLLSLAVAGTVLGLGARAGTAGLTGGFVFFVVAAALSAWSSAPEMMPAPWGGLGQLTPPGAGVTLLRSAAYFRGAGGGDPAAVLTVWAALGVALVMVGDTRGWLGGSRRAETPDEDDDEAVGFPGIPVPVPASAPTPVVPAPAADVWARAESSARTVPPAGPPVR
ncbi:hypothetical protein [Pseudofrankia sp. BMG5.37]|uniref:hypothetical protein n=1 Tax=Pseudofrankia sp. BMG5.37 TaxID=3050035 RepID=UPI00289439DF|nr:hypothetical protein [Pseudofrankia sp. BMG5.37]MDT3441693.1 hypothetical protein [Pseudofrankia sp. BMG5.37]